MLGLTIDILNERMDNEEVCAFANIPTTKKSIQLICLGSKTSTTMKIPLPKIQHDKDLSAITPNDSIKMH